ncbi:2-hydroxychromene-2-carboxylate isomerase [Pseudoduganella violaceinigra]|uniref:2-hydroxychromene-2-carboxylate isomerase n=1 Tax=Pseudoduganella violaceinigra TaxID=246602 RepID=UPI00040C306E|nr:2-hydroxychromene-2-carboxylate isomerase [Pseudoduganella violaceinigra]
MVLDFYFDFASGYSYFAARRIEWLAAANGATVRWHPVLLSALTQATGVLPSPVVPLKWTYVTRDMQRTAQEEAIPFNPSPAFPQMLIAPGRAMLWIRAQHGEELAKSFARTCFQAYYADGVDIADKAVLLGIAEGLGIDGAAFLTGMEEPATKAQFKQGSEDALAKGVFGVPFVLADGEPFWGYDRFPQLERWLAAARRAA